jgi:tetratricopeptide (TPR) repeat protein
LKTRLYISLFLSLVVLCIGLLEACRDNENKITSAEDNPYLNHHDSAYYVGMETCRQCHADKYETFIHTGMGSSIDWASKEKSAAIFAAHTRVYDSIADLYYHPHWKDSALFITEYRLNGKDTVHKRSQKIDHIIGSGQHTNSHLYFENGYLFQAPLTWYSQEKKWDLPPGFENGFNTRYSRKIGLECMTCHNSLPEFVKGSENKYQSIPNGINCERCHGPGSVHVALKMKGEIIDTSRYIDYSIVNPAKLSVDLQFDICQRCHLQGNTILSGNHSFEDFRPGKKLSDFMTVFLPRYTTSDDEFIMASHADRMKLSACFVESEKRSNNSNSLKPYKNALTCVTCHNPHVSVKSTNENVYNKACNNCHNPDVKVHTICSEKQEILHQASNNCVSCHMPKSSSIDIPHVSVHDHYIRKPVKQKEQQAIKTFLSLVPVNNHQADYSTRAEAYLNQFEKFDNQPMMLDSAFMYCRKMGNAPTNKSIELWVRYFFLKKDLNSLMNYCKSIGLEKLLRELLNNKSMQNRDAWTAYRIGEAFSDNQDAKTAFQFYEKACELAPFNAEFANKKASALLSLNQPDKARKIFEELTREHPYFAPAFSNLGYLMMLENNYPRAEMLLNKALLLDPDYELAVFNKAGLLMQQQRTKEALNLVSRFSKRYPNNLKAKQFIQSIQ